MTVVAYRDGIMAGDGRVCSGSIIEEDGARKVFRLPDGTLVGVSGKWARCQAFVRIMTKASEAEKKKLPSDVIKGIDALVVDPKGKTIWYYESGAWLKVKTPYTCIGSGYVSALAAMDAGATAEEAVRIACKRHVHCGGRVSTVSLK
jgi:20S proteasome alpha/beta subunit